MKYIILMFVFILFSEYHQNRVIENKQLPLILKEYIATYDNIPNLCHAKPYYKIEFKRAGSSLGFWIAAYLGEPGVVPPSPPGKKQDNPKEMKGAFNYLGTHVVVYDFKNSDGYGIYNPNNLSLEILEKLKELPQKCVNVKYPEAWYFTIKSDTILKTTIRESFMQK